MSEIWFEIRVGENLDERWSGWFEGVRILPLVDEGNRTGTMLYGCLPDQTAIFGLLTQVRNLNLTLVEFKRTEKDSRCEKK